MPWLIAPEVVQGRMSVSSPLWRLLDFEVSVGCDLEFELIVAVLGTPHEAVAVVLNAGGLQNAGFDLEIFCPSPCGFS